MGHIKPFCIAAAIFLLLESGNTAISSRNTAQTSQNGSLSETIFLSNVTRSQSTAQQSYSNRTSAYRLLQTDWQLPEGTCNEKIPCANGACCSRVSQAVVAAEAVTD